MYVLISGTRISFGINQVLSCLILPANTSVFLAKSVLLFSLTSIVNFKKDSENTPVKGGTMADLGERLLVLYIFIYMQYTHACI